MRRTITSMLFLFTFGVSAAAGTPAALAADSCSNAAFRTGPGAALPDCRAYELVSPDLNHAALGTPGGRSSTDGETIVYQAIDAPNQAGSATVFNDIRAKRDPVKGWSGASLSSPLSLPTTSYQASWTVGISTDLSSTVEITDQPLLGASSPKGQNTYVGRSDGTFQFIATSGGGFDSFTHTWQTWFPSWGNSDYSYVLTNTALQQLPEDPVPGNLYGWSTQRGLKLVGILPDGTPAPGGVGLAGGLLAPASDDGRRVLFTTNGPELYMRTDDAHTVDIRASQRTINPDPNPTPPSGTAGMTFDGSEALFTSKAELTNDANTGSSGGVATDAGNDLYSYDTASGELTDLTVDENPADAATGANVQLILGATQDGSHIYFTSGSDLAPGAKPGHLSLYVWHEGQIDFVASADRLYRASAEPAPRFSITPDGKHAAFPSTESLTGYDNTDPVTGQPHVEVFEATIGGGIACASCRPDGTRPTNDSMIPINGLDAMGGPMHTMSNDGGRLFFQSSDAILPQATSGREQVFEYSNGKVSPISRVESPTSAIFIDTDATGDNAFFGTHDDLVPNPNSGDYMVFDARVDGGFPVPANERCPTLACQSPTTPTPVLPTAASVDFLDAGNLPVAVGAALSSRMTVSKTKTITGTAGSLKVRVPGTGRLTVSGSGLRTRSVSSSKAESIAVRVQLTGAAVKALGRGRSFKTKVKVVFSDSAGHVSTATVSLTFKRKGL